MGFSLGQGADLVWERYYWEDLSLLDVCPFYWWLMTRERLKRLAKVVAIKQVNTYLREWRVHPIQLGRWEKYHKREYGDWLSWLILGEHYWGVHQKSGSLIDCKKSSHHKILQMLLLALLAFESAAFYEGVRAERRLTSLAMVTTDNNFQNNVFKQWERRSKISRRKWLQFYCLSTKKISKISSPKHIFSWSIKYCQKFPEKVQKKDCYGSCSKKWYTIFFLILMKTFKWNAARLSSEVFCELGRVGCGRRWYWYNIRTWEPYNTVAIEPPALVSPKRSSNKRKYFVTNGTNFPFPCCCRPSNTCSGPPFFCIKNEPDSCTQYGPWEGEDDPHQGRHEQLLFKCAVFTIILGFIEFVVYLLANHL